jgi:tetratricopeptide (TPR) repeat protein
MNRSVPKIVAMLVFSFTTATAWAQSEPPRVEKLSARKDGKPAQPPAPAQLLFGALPVSTHSVEARQFVEKSLDEYENVMLEESLVDARKAAEKDPEFALAFAMWSFAARRDEPDAAALAKANALAAFATPEEKLLVHWMTATQSRDLLPAIQLMNDLLGKFPKDKHILYLTAEWLYFQQDYDRSRRLFEATLKVDPDFPPALNMLGYAYIETGDPDPGKAIAALRRYAELQPNQPNPRDSLGEIYRFTGNDHASLDEYTAALKIQATFYTSQLGLGDTSALMGDYDRARSEFQKAIALAPSGRDRLHIAFQRALINFWEGKPEQGRAEITALAERAAREKDPYAQYEIGLGQAFLAGNPDEEMKVLDAVEGRFTSPIQGMSENDRQTALASVMRERVRLLSLAGKTDAAATVIQKLETLAVSSRDSIIENCYDSARGFLLFAKGNYAGAVDALESDTQNPLVTRQAMLAYEELGDAAGASAAKTRLRYLRAPTPQWYLATHPATAPTAASNQ